MILTSSGVVGFWFSDWFGCGFVIWCVIRICGFVVWVLVFGFLGFGVLGFWVSDRFGCWT